jgi:CheY-like chemotaxis protein
MAEKNTASKKILVADDSLTIQKVIRLALSGDGYEIQTVSNGKEAVEQASLFRPDICIVDVSLPHFDAYQIREQFLAKPDLKNIPIILMSSAFEKVDESRAQNLGFAGHLIKPFDPSHLRSTLLAVVNQTPQNDPVTATINEPMDEFLRSPIKLESALPANDLPPLTQDFGNQNFNHQEFGGHTNPNIAAPEPAAFGNQDFGNIPSGMDDIQRMARNTFEMSGLNQHDWGMIEPGKPDELPPEPQYQPETHGAFSNQNANEVGVLDFQEVPHSPGYSGQAQHQVNVTPAELEGIVKVEVAKLMEQMRAQLMSDLQSKLERELQEFAREKMPDLAEKMIKEEIHKLLSEPPV